MSKGATGLKNITQVDQLGWLASVKVGGSKRGSNSSETGSGVRSRINSQSRPPPGIEGSGSDTRLRSRSLSRSRVLGDERKDGDAGHSLQDEFVSK